MEVVALSIIGYAFLCFFCVYGFIQMVFYIMDIVYESKPFQNKKIYTVVFVKNEEKTIENTAKSLLWKAVKNDTGIADREITIIDMGSADKTVEIVKAMERDEKGIRLRTMEEFAKQAEYEMARKRS